MSCRFIFNQIEGLVPNSAIRAQKTICICTFHICTVEFSDNKVAVSLYKVNNNRDKNNRDTGFCQLFLGQTGVCSRTNSAVMGPVMTPSLKGCLLRQNAFILIILSLTGI